ncbi:UDP-N-acetylglucosamine transferase subunit ALG13 [Paenibacillus amylolyticus]|uniref:UDP-N-acetylglucosamine transferase subunit ALG13 n=1 Tax=Paenibacillus amylolyticus TaxID=1451 RepID=A0AAP5H3D4_PAEAM|nr:PssE/Cps14G family polysaccharide biosynthesis glycosyltransferase [Paenibacillus amylolyticus]MDR6724018.1 UDP-N-acetylglucosamine transferase subunit ALG13 [Paenibacillus amylolyticus]
MIFVVLGTQRFQFNRLLQAVDNLIQEGKLPSDVLVQSGYSEYKPRHYQHKPFFNQEEMNEHIAKSEFVLSHAGVGVITSALQMNKKVIVMPRRKDQGEHVDNHQLEIAKVFQDKGYISVAQNEDELSALISNLDQLDFKPYVKSNSQLLSSIKGYINSL